MRRFVSLYRFGTAVIDSKLLKVGKNTERKFGSPCVAAKLISGVSIFLYVYRMFFSFLRTPPIRKP